MAAFFAAEPPNAAVRAIQRRPERIFVVDMISQAEHDRVPGKPGGRLHENAKVVDRHDRVDCRDHRRRVGEPAGDELEAGV